MCLFWKQISSNAQYFSSYLVLNAFFFIGRLSENKNYDKCWEIVSEMHTN